jgi:hypothetical protein
MAALTPSPATAAAADFRAWPPADSGRDMPPTGVANLVVGGGANPDKPPPRGASMELARDGGRMSDMWSDAWVVAFVLCFGIAARQYGRITR